ncbi:hypothetical protein SBA5_530008 [Candidatus Sulfotelmatomonas gaucii]|uniref:Uncharacterized protein n=1 Tax=Candidatus Sulfuritelmatomonas gaucii TaxID=2043161 RepID=A0A2N9LSP5_9BACT|nr:hypothetical protein SBA5_530008 [Candidatus Sulfotelmatomonas gaucii]
MLASSSTTRIEAGEPLPLPAGVELDAFTGTASSVVGSGMDGIP